MVLVASLLRFLRNTHTQIYNKHKRQTFIPSAEFEPGITEIKPFQTYTFDRTATEIGIAL